MTIHWTTLSEQEKSKLIHEAFGIAAIFHEYLKCESCSSIQKLGSRNCEYCEGDSLLSHRVSKPHPPLTVDFLLSVAKDEDVQLWKTYLFSETPDPVGYFEYRAVITDLDMTQSAEHRTEGGYVEALAIAMLRFKGLQIETK